MTRKPNKPESRRRSTAIFKAKRSRSKPLMARAASVRTANTRSSMSSALNGKAPTPLNPALTMIAMMGRVMGAYAEFPARLAQCRSPMDGLVGAGELRSARVQRVTCFGRSAIARAVSIKGQP